VVTSSQGIQANFLRGTAVVLVGLRLVMQISHDERLRLACNVVICVGRGRKIRKYFMNTRESSTTSLLPAVDAQGGVSGTQKVRRDAFPECTLSACSSEDPCARDSGYHCA